MPHRGKGPTPFMKKKENMEDKKKISEMMVRNMMVKCFIVLIGREQLVDITLEARNKVS